MDTLSRRQVQPDVFAIAFLLLIPVLLSAFWAFDQLVRLEYESYRTNWEDDGKPRGVFWYPPEVRGWVWPWTWQSERAFQRCAFVWLFLTPEWVRRDAKGLRLIFRLRFLVLTWGLGVLGAWIYFVL